MHLRKVRADSTANQNRRSNRLGPADVINVENPARFVGIEREDRFYERKRGQVAACLSRGFEGANGEFAMRSLCLNRTIED